MLGPRLPLRPGFSAFVIMLSEGGLVYAALSVLEPGRGLAWVAPPLLVWLSASTALGQYGARSARRAVWDEIATTAVVVMLAALTASMLLVIGPPGGQSGTVGRFVLTAWPAALMLRLGLLRALARRERPVDNVVVVGAGALARCTMEDLAKDRSRRIIGSFTLPKDGAPDASDTVARLEDSLRGLDVTEVYVAAGLQQHGGAMQTVVNICERLGLPFALPAYAFRMDRARPLARSAVKDGYLHFQAVDEKPLQQGLKRLLDLVVSATALAVLSPALAVIAALVRLSSRGPVLFVQRRCGQLGREFGMLKFRSMHVGAETAQARLWAQNEQRGPVFKMKNDPRVTPLGRFLRRYSLDELPQLWNVLRGDMSLVGPRPPLPVEVARYEPWQRRRLSVRPGLTCIWQVSGRNQISFEEWMYLDMQYIDHWSLQKDLALLLRTVPVVVSGRGAS